MNSYGNGGSFARQLVTWLVIGVLAVIALKIALAFVGLALKMVLVATFTLGPLLLVGWLVLKALRYFSRPAEANNHI